MSFLDKFMQKPQENPESVPIQTPEQQEPPKAEQKLTVGLQEAIGLLMEPSRRQVLKAYCFPNTPATARVKLGFRNDRVRKHTAVLLEAGLVQKLERPKARTREGKVYCPYQPYLITELGKAALRAVGEEVG